MIQFELDVVRPLTSQVNPPSNHWLWDPMVTLVRNTGVGLGLTQLNRLAVNIWGNYVLHGPQWLQNRWKFFNRSQNSPPQIKIIGEIQKNRGIFE